LLAHVKRFVIIILGVTEKMIGEQLPCPWELFNSFKGISGLYLPSLYSLTIVYSYNLFEGIEELNKEWRSTLIHSFRKSLKDWKELYIA